MRSPRDNVGTGSRTRILVPVLCLTGLALLVSCATIEAPRGGPEDKTPPVVIAFAPDSGAVGLEAVDEIVVEFSEKMTPKPAETVLNTYPDLEIAKTRWQGRRRMIAELVDPLPADTVIVVEVRPGLQDNHRVPSERGWTFPLATADSFPPGRFTGQILLEGEPVGDAVAEIYDEPPDSVAWERQPLLRRAVTDTTGRFALDWLTPPGGPWLLRLYVDESGDGRAGENEPQRLWPGTWSLAAEAPVRDLGLFELFKPTTPGQLLGLAPDSLAADSLAAAVFGWPASVAEDDTGFAVDHLRTAPAGQLAVVPGDTTFWSEAGPGLVRLILFADQDGDSLLSAVADTVTADSLLWTWEPFTVVDSLEVEPGRPLDLLLPAPPATRTLPATAPPTRDRGGVAPPDSLTAALMDSLGLAGADSLPPVATDVPDTVIVDAPEEE